jgi:hypothetical protein
MGIGHRLSEVNRRNVIMSCSSSTLAAFYLEQLKKWDMVIAPGNWLTLAFPNHRLRLTHYALCTRIPAAVANWILSTSQDGQNWTLADSRPETFQISPIMTLELPAPVECSFLRIRFDAANWPQELRGLCIRGFDVFGTILN